MRTTPGEPEYDVPGRAVYTVEVGLRWGECAGLSWRPGRPERRRAHRESDAGGGQRPVRDQAVPQVPGRRPDHSAAHHARVAAPGAPGARRPQRARPAVHHEAGRAWRRTNFRAQVWLPAVAAAGLPNGMRFHDLRHCYATWLVSDGVPINEVQRLLGHEQASTTLDRYSHPTRGHDAHVRGVFAAPADFLLTFGPDPHPRLPESRPRSSRRTASSPQVRPPMAWEDGPSPPS